jgi:hypothetical protein
MARVLSSLAFLGLTFGSASFGLSAQPQATVEPQALTDWDRVIRGFRRDHNFTLGLGRAMHRWEGNVPGQADRFRFSSEGWQLDFGYSFHLPLGWGFGYTLGTQTGFGFSESSGSGFRTAFTLHLPGWEVGLIWNLNERWRFFSSLIYSWQRVDRLQLPPERGSQKVALTGDARGYRFAIDYFYNLSWGLRVEGEALDFSYDSKEDLDLRKTGRTLRLAIVKHLL